MPAQYSTKVPIVSALSFRRPAASASTDEFDREKDAFLSSVSHDLKNPLTTIAGTAQLLERQLSRHGSLTSEEVAGACATIRRAVSRAVVELDEMMEVARLGSGHAPLELQLGPTDLVGLARGMVGDHTRSSERNPITFASSEPSLVGSWDAVRLERALSNLIGNAVKYSPDGGPIEVRVSRQSADLRPAELPGARRTKVEWAVLSVVDHGMGIPLADLPHVFQRYRRATNVPEYISGTGIGLADVRSVAERHGGWVEVDSVEGTGTVFTVWLPLASALAGARETRRSPHTPSLTQAETN